MSVSQPQLERESGSQPHHANAQDHWLCLPQEAWKHRRIRVAVLLLIAVALLLPVWSVRYPPITDYPNHLASAYVLAHLDEPALGFGRYYSADWNTSPYLAMDVILIGLQRVVSVDIAGRLLLSLCLLAIPVATWFFIRKANPGQNGLAFWSLLIAHNLYFFQLGLINQQLGLALCLVLIGVWLDFLSRPRVATWCVLLLLAVALFFTHFLAFAMAGFAMTAYAAISRQRLFEFARLWALFVPGMVLFRNATAQHLAANWDIMFGLSGKGAGLLAFTITGISNAVDFLTTLFVIAALATAILDNREFEWNRNWVFITVCTLVLYFVFPVNFGPRAMIADRRLVPFLFVFLLASIKVGRRAGLVATIAVLLVVFRAGVIENDFIQAQRNATALSRSFSAIPRGARVLALGPTSDRMQHFWAYGVIEHGWLSPCLFQNPGVLPLRTRFQNDSACGYQGHTKPLDWTQIQKDYDYAWLYKTHETSPEGTVVYSDGELRVLRLSRAFHY